MAPKFVRVKDKNTGHHYTISEVIARNDKGLEILKGEAAVTASGKPIAPKYNINSRTSSGASSGSQEGVTT